MNRQVFLLMIAIAGLEISLLGAAGAEPSGYSDKAFASALSAGAVESFVAPGNTPKIPRTVAVEAEDAGQARPTTIFSNNSNAGDIYRMMLTQGAKPDCRKVSVFIGGAPATREACEVQMSLETLPVNINNIVERHSFTVKPQGPTTCGQSWRAVHSAHFESSMIYHYCRFTEASKP